MRRAPVWTHDELDADVEAERARMWAEREAVVEAMRTADREALIAPVRDALTFIIDAVGVQKIPVLIQHFNRVTIEDLKRGLNAAHTRAQADNQQRRDDEHRAARLKLRETAAEATATAAGAQSRAKRQAELDQGAL